MPPSLKRALKFTRLIAITMGTPLASSVFVSIMLMEQITSNLPTLILAIVISTILAALVSLSYGELVSIYPSAAGNRVFLKKPLGNLSSLTFSFMWTIVILVAAGVEAYVLGNVLHFLFNPVSPIAWSTIALTLILIINIFGVELSGNFQMGVTFFVAASLVAISLAAWLTAGRPPQMDSSVNLVDAFSAAAVGVYFFLGFGRVTTLGEEAIDYKRGIPTAMPIAIIILGIVFLFISSAIFIKVPINVVAGSPVPQILLGKYILNRSTAVVVAAVSVIMSFGAFNAGLLGTSRLIYALGREGTLPSVLGRINTRFFTPTWAILFIYFVTLTVTVTIYFTKSFATPVVMAALYDSFMYAMVSYSALWHHRKTSASNIPFQVKGGRALFTFTTAVFIVLGLILVYTYPSAALLIAIGIVATLIYFLLKARQHTIRPDHHESSSS